ETRSASIHWRRTAENPATPARPEESGSSLVCWWTLRSLCAGSENISDSHWCPLAALARRWFCQFLVPGLVLARGTAACRSTRPQTRENIAQRVYSCGVL